MKQHKWHKEIKAWADGAEIEFKGLNGEWYYKSYPHWNNDDEYRIKPQPKEPQYLYVYLGVCNKADFEYFVSELEPSVMQQFKYIGKIKLEVEDDI